MVTKSKLKLALAAERGVDFKKADQKKKAKASVKRKFSKDANAAEDMEDWEDVDEANNDLNEADPEESSESDDEAPAVKVCILDLS